MTAKPPATRQADLEARKKAAGLVRVCVWARPEDAPAIRLHAAKVLKKSAKAAAVLDRPIDKKQKT